DGAAAPARTPAPVRPPVAAVPPTDPLPPGFSGIAAPAAVTAVAPSSRRRTGLRRLASIAVMIAAIVLFATEGGAWVAAERFRTGLAALDGRMLPQMKAGYDSIGASSLLHLG